MADPRSEDRSESPTPRRVLRARRFGQVAVSRALATAFSMAAVGVVVGVLAPAGIGGLVVQMREALLGATKSTPIASAAWAGLRTAGVTLAIPLGALIGVAVVVGAVQTRGLVTLTPLRPDAGRLLPSFRRLLGRDPTVETGKEVLSLAILGCVAWWSTFSLASMVTGLGGASATQVLHTLGVAGQRLGGRLVVAMLALGGADYLLQRYRQRKSLRMSRDEVKREQREEEGEPEQKAARLRLHRELLQELGEVRRADFVVVHLGVIAVAVSYDGENAPVVLVKGKGHLALAIAEVAGRAGVPVVDEPALARALSLTEVGHENLGVSLRAGGRGSRGERRFVSGPKLGSGTMALRDSSPPTAMAREILLEVAVSLPVSEVFTYRDVKRDQPLPLGSQVVVPFGRRTVTGFVVGHVEAASPALRGDVRAILEVVGTGPALDESVLALCRWAASYYVAPLGEVLSAALPSGERASTSRRFALTAAGKAAVTASGPTGLAALALDAQDRAFLARLKKARTLSLAGTARSSAKELGRVNFLVEHGFIEISDAVRGAKRRRVDVGRDTTNAKTSQAELPPTLNDCQQTALATIVGALDAGYATFVLQGITGSGKTEVYLRAIAEVRKRGRGALVLVPEIALTPQLASRFRARFGDDVAVLHSALPEGERSAAWRRLRGGEVGIAVGARSAVFAPVRDLAIVVVDEEHDGSFKQEDGFRYNARDLAVMRASQSHAIAILGSATPCLETCRNVILGRFTRLLLPVRANPLAAARPLPPVEILDLRQRPPGPDGLLSPPLAMAIDQALAAGEQTILFLNRRGFSTFLHCRDCGHVFRCDACAVSLTLHRARGQLLCHYCGRSEPIRDTCPKCKGHNLEGMGSGTERVEAIVRERFPQARVARLDRDSAPVGRGRLDALLDQVHRREIDILIGTQMVTKGHDFGGVTLVGVLQPDQGIHLPDFRASERSFQIMEQVAGRAGRGERPGRILVQTYSPEHPAIQFLKRHDYDGFVQDELGRREIAGYPPYSRMVVLRLDGRDASDVREAAHAAAGRARAIADAAVRVLGPCEAPIARLRGRARYQVWLSSEDRGKLLTVTRATQRVPLPRGVRLEVDVDPQSVL